MANETEKNVTNEPDCFEKLAICVKAMADMIHKLATGIDKAEEELTKSPFNRKLEKEARIEKYVKERAGDLTKPFFNKDFDRIIDSKL